MHVYHINTDGGNCIFPTTPRFLPIADNPTTPSSPFPSPSSNGSSSSTHALTNGTISSYSSPLNEWNPFPLFVVVWAVFLVAFIVVLLVVYRKKFWRNGQGEEKPLVNDVEGQGENEEGREQGGAEGPVGENDGDDGSEVTMLRVRDSLDRRNGKEGSKKRNRVDRGRESEGTSTAPETVYESEA